VTGTGAPAALVDHALRTLAERNPQLNAVVHPAEPRAPEPDGDGPLVGVPFTAKSVLATRDLPTTCGSRSLAGHRAGRDATAVERLRRAGAVLVGVTNCAEFALGVDTVNDLYGRTRNPLGPFVSGGSSGGDAVAVATGMATVGLGTDYGGSVRWPAQCTAIVALRPTVGRVSRAGMWPDVFPEPRTWVGAPSLYEATHVVGPLARTIADLDAVLRVIAGPDGRDGTVVDRPLGSLDDVAVARVEVRAMVPPGADAATTAALRAAADTLARLGLAVDPGGDAELEEAADLFDRLRASEPMPEVARLAAERPDDVGAAARGIVAGIRPVDPAVRGEWWTRRDEVLARLTSWLAGERLLLLPVSLRPPWDPASESHGMEVLRPSRAISLLGLPAVSVPVGRTSAGQPLSVQLVAPPFREDVALALAAALHEACPPGTVPDGA
jgi:amidase